MRATDRSLRWLLTAALAVATSIALEPIVESARPLADRVTIRRDTFGVPHILAEDEEAAAYALGYAQAEDHVLEIARRYLSARGEAARVFGRESLESDVAMQRLDNIGAARKALGEVGKPFRRVLHAFAAGVNRFVDEHRATLPAWVPSFEAADVLAYTRAGAVTGALGPGNTAELRRKYDPRAAATPAPTAAPPESAEGDGSNALALAGSRTTTGKAILLGNPHLRWSSLYWEAHITVPDSINFYGSTLAGLPTLRAGFNDRLGYVQTNNDPDLEDFYALTLADGRNDRYLFRGRTRTLSRKEIEVDVLESDGRITTERREHWDSHLGPVVYRTPERVFVLRSMSLESWRYFEGFQDLLHARDLRGFLSRLERNVIPTSNFTYADVDGNVLYQWNARLPKREEEPGTSYELDVPGESKRYLWRGLHKVRDLPRLLNPPGGAIQNANNSPWWTSLADRLDMARYPAYVERNPLGLRPQRALQMLDAERQFSVDAVRALKFDVRVLLADRVLDDLLAAGRLVPDPSSDLSEALEVLAAWDRHAAASSRGTALFLRFWDTYRQAAREPFAVAWSADAPMETPRGLADPTQAVAALARAAAAIRKEHGRLDPQWGDIVRFRFGDIDLPGDGADGSYGLYRVMRFDGPRTGEGARGAAVGPGIRVAGRVDTAQPPAGFGDGWVLLVHFARPVEAWSVLAYGQSSNPGSPHGRDQIQRFAKHELRRVWFSEAEIAEHLERSYRPPR